MTDAADADPPGTRPSPAAAAPPSSRLMVLLFTDVVGSVKLKADLGLSAYARLLARHDALFRSIVGSTPGAEVRQDTGDGFYAAFATPADAVSAGLRFQIGLRSGDWDPRPLGVRVGVHVGLMQQVSGTDVDGYTKMVGLGADLAARVMSLALPGQVLMTRAVFDDARLYVRSIPGGDRLAGGSHDTPPQWLAHGRYKLAGQDEPVDVYEAGVPGVSPLVPPPDSEKAKRFLGPDEEQTLGWRPATGRDIPGRPGWLVDRKLGEGGFGEVWLGRHGRTKAERVFKFCFDADRLRSLKRELTLFRLMKEALGDRPDIATLHDVRLDQPPFFLESDYSPLGDLAEWAGKQGGIDKVAPAARLDLVARTAEAVAAAHSVGVLHKDLKPSNILVYVAEDGSPRPRLADFGIGILTDRDRLEGLRITAVGFTETLLTQNESSRTGTRMYAPPELLTGKPFTTQGDVYALGVLLYQVSVGDLARPLAAGWERDVPDDLLRADVAACVEGDSARRLATAHELAVRVRSLDARRAAAAEQARAEAAARRRKRLLRATSVGLVLAVGATAAGVGVARREQRLREQEQVLRRDADAARAAEAVERSRADAQRAVAERALADRTMTEADARAADGRWDDARALLRQARPLLAAQGRPTLAADLRLWQSYRLSPPPLAVLSRAKTSAVALSADGRRAATGHLDGTIAVWDVPRQQVTATMALPTLPLPERAMKLDPWTVAALAMTPDGKLLLAGGKDLRATLWDLDRREVRHQLLGPQNQIFAVALSPDGTTAASGGWSREVHAWDLRDGTRIWFHPFQKPPRERVTGVAFTADSRRVAIAYGGGGGLELFDAKTGAAAGSFAGRGLDGITCVAASPGDPDVLAVGDDLGGVRLLSVKATAVTKVLAGHRFQTDRVAFTAGGATLVSAGGDGLLRVWDVATGRQTGALPAVADGPQDLAASADGRFVAVAGADATAVRTLAARPGEALVPALDGPHRWRSCAVAPGGRVGAVAGGGGVQVFDLATGKVLRQDARAFVRATFYPEVVPLRFSPDEQTLTWGDDRHVGTLDLPTGRVAVVETAGRGRVVGLSDDARSAALDAGAAGIEVVDLPSLAVRQKLAGTGDVQRADFLPSGRLLVSADATKTEKVLVFKSWVSRRAKELSRWDLATGRKLDAVVAEDAQAFGTGVRAGGDQVLVPLAGPGAAVWDLAAKRRRFVVHATGGGVLAACLSAGGRVAVTAGALDRTLRFWDAEAGTPLATLDAADLGVTDVAASPDGRWVAYAGFRRDGGAAAGAGAAGAGGAVGAAGEPGGAGTPAAHAVVRDLWRHEAFAALEPRVATRWKDAAAGTAADPAALRLLGDWYALQGVPGWSADAFAAAAAGGAGTTGGAAEPSVTRARSCWLAGDGPGAAAEFERVLAVTADPAEQAYLRLCAAAARDAPK
jgi:WD40 repeat protein/class 3 adenylate cyclase